jgi:hypothetical protein
VAFSSNGRPVLVRIPAALSWSTICVPEPERYKKR